MNKCLCLLLAVILAVTLCACTPEPEDLPVETTMPIVIPPKPVVPETTIPEPTVPETTKPEHSAYYIPGVAVEDVILWFNEVALDSEFSYGGDATVIQKWMVPIVYTIDGNATEEDLQILEDFAGWLNGIEGFPGIRPAGEEDLANLQIRFGDSQMILDFLGPEYENVDGGIRYWYENNAIYDARIAYRNDISQHTANIIKYNLTGIIIV